MTAGPEKWNAEGRKLISDLDAVPSEQRLEFIFKRIESLDDSIRDAVFHFVTAAARTHEIDVEKIKSDNLRVGRLSLLIVFLGILGFAFAALGVFFISAEIATSVIDGFGLKVETRSIGVASLAIGAVIVIATVLAAIKKM